MSDDKPGSPEYAKMAENVKAALGDPQGTYSYTREPVIGYEGSPTFRKYQAAAKETAAYPPEAGVYYTALGLAGEAGEIANKVKKVVRDDGGKVTIAARADLRAELGDVLWYCAQLATELDIDLGEVAEQNIRKLRSRKERGTIQGSGDNR